MDIFGHASLYQFINRTTSQIGTVQLATWLLQPASISEITERQAAIKELSEKTKWRQQLQAYGKEKTIQLNTQTRLQQWIQEPTIFLQFKAWRWLRIVLPAIILTITGFAIFDIVTMNIFYFALFIYGIIAYQINKIVSPLHLQLSKIIDELGTLSQSIQAIESENFESPFLQNLKERIVDNNNPASKKIKHLKKILDRLDLRYNLVLSAPLNLLLLWNLQQVLDLEKWKKQYPNELNNWFTTLGIFEALNSFATIYFNNPSWVFPELREKHFFIETTNLGHPLINETKRVNNFLSIVQSAEIMLVTGSNMAGKSTYLRSVGINVILAMAGAPVCADKFALSPVQLISSMRIADNLEESTSTFYAELKKLKTVIDKVNNKENVFILLDEILRGTNSLDRHTGSVALIKQLIKENAAAIIATHDVALAALKNEFPKNILNYHFDVQVNKLKPGVCTSMNASILMKKIGIEL
jgi:predicted ATPase